MNYLIDDSVVFDSENGTLSQTFNLGRSSILPKPAVLLLEVLVNHPGVIMSRNTLMEAAWLDAGLTLSGHNLSTYIKVIRHSLSELEIEKEFIRTMPRVGLVLTVSVRQEANDLPKDNPIVLEQNFVSINEHSTLENPKPTVTLTVPQDAPTLMQANAVKEQSSIKKKHFFPLYVMVVTIICTIVQIFWPVAPPLDFAVSNERLKKISSLAKCQVFTLENPGNLVLSGIETTLRSPEIVKSCSNDPHYIFFSALQFENREKTTAVMCRFDAMTHAPKECTTYSREFEND